MRNRGAISLALSLCLHLLVALLWFLPQQQPKVEPLRKVSLGNLKLETLPHTKLRPSGAAAQPQQPAIAQPSTQPNVQPKPEPKQSQPKPAQKRDTATKSTPKQTTQEPSAPPSFYQLLQEPNAQTPWQELYGDEFYSLSKEDKAYLDENYRKIYAITQRNLRYPPQAGRLGLQGSNRVEFYLQPNGDITDLKITTPSGYEMFDKNSLHTIEISYKDYPHPKKPLKIIFYINYKIGY